MKETLLAEQEKVILAITEEKLKVSAEKIRLETSAKLQQNYDSQKGQVEMDAAIQAAKEATMQTDEERKSLYRQQAEAETLRRNLNDKEQKLNFREAELQSVIKNIERKALDGEHALNEAKTLQTKYNERLKDIQRQLTSLAGRERKLNEEKIILSKERLALQSNIREIKRCSLCTTDNRCANEPELLNDVVEHDIPMPRQMVSTF